MTSAAGPEIEPSKADAPAWPPRVLVTLRDGLQSGPVFMFPGTGGKASELSGLAQHLKDPGAMIGVESCIPDGQDGFVKTIPEMASASLAAIRAMQVHGPYRLVGYSFGAIVALEVARALQDRGERVARLVLLDPVYDQRYWPQGVWLRSQARILIRHLLAVMKTPPGQVWPVLRQRAAGLSRRLLGRVAPQAAAGGGGVSSMQRACVSAMEAYRPAFYPGRLVMLTSEPNHEYGCNLASIWRGLAERVETHTIRESHLGLVHDARSQARLAEQLDRCLAPPGEGSPGTDRADSANS